MAISAPGNPYPSDPFNNNGMMGNNWRPGIPPSRTLPGFFVSRPEDIAPRDVPMDRSISFFPANDLSSITIKQWNTNGTIDTMTFVPFRPEPQPQPQSVGKPEPQQVPNAPQAPEPANPMETMFGELTAAITALNQKLDTIVPTKQEHGEEYG